MLKLVYCLTIHIAKCLRKEEKIMHFLYTTCNFLNLVRSTYKSYFPIKHKQACAQTQTHTHARTHTHTLTHTQTHAHTNTHTHTQTHTHTYIHTHTHMYIIGRPVTSLPVRACHIRPLICSTAGLHCYIRNGFHTIYHSPPCSLRPY